MEQFLSRKFIFAMLIEVLSAVFVMTGRMTTTDWSVFTAGVGSIYVIGNLTENFINKTTSQPEQQEVTVKLTPPGYIPQSIPPVAH